MSTPAWQRRYHQYLRSPAWKKTRYNAILRAANRCERCQVTGGIAGVGLEVHHRHYRSLHAEKPEDLMVLCPPCHEQADEERARENAANAAESLAFARLDGWARKKYGDDWEFRHDAEAIEDEFDRWLEEKEEW